MFRLRKWYFDFLSPRHEYVFLYFATVDVAGIRFRSLTVHCARPESGWTATRSVDVSSDQERGIDGGGCTILTPHGELRVSAQECVIRISDSECSVGLEFTSHGTHIMKPAVISRGGIRRHLWTPVGLKYHVSGTVTIDGECLTVDNADGYVDYLESSFLPPLNPVRTLSWGRLHHSDVNLAFMRAEGSGAVGPWSKLSGWIGDETLESDNVRIEKSGRDPRCYSVLTETSFGELRLDIRRLAAVQTGSFIDQQDIALPGAAALVKLVTRNPRSMKFFCSADINIGRKTRSMDLRNIHIIDEEAFL